jgi:hypothetical protein
VEINKDKMIGSNGDFITQALFLEPFYDQRFATYTFKDWDHEYKGKVYPSIKRLYLEMEDVTEYLFATTYFMGWKHWRRLQGNKILKSHFDDWREELEIKLRGQAIRDIIGITADNSQGSFQAAKWLADKGWDKRTAGRPNKAEMQREDRIKEKVAEEYSGDVARMSDYKGN